MLKAILVSLIQLYVMNKLSKADLKNIDEVKASGSVPEHIAIIMDGNGRWAKSKGYPRVVGHKQGVKTVRTVVETCANLGVKFLTLYTFSTENWKRPKNEVSTLMRLIVSSLKDETDQLHKNNIKLNAIGALDKLPGEVQKELEDARERTKNNTRMTLNLALSYSGRLELINAIKSISNNVKNGLINPEQIDEEMVNRFLFTQDMPDPDLLIRSGGEYRISNFLLWQIAYSEIYVTSKLWPDFSTDDVLDAIRDFQKRERRFGLVSEQIKNEKNTNNDKDFSSELPEV
jgi:undecaprenyl diphosphate synthase